MFRRLPPAPEYPIDVLQSIAGTMQEQVPAGWNAAAPILDGDNPDIPSAYTYLGQFIDHDLTFDPASSLQRQNDPDALVNYRSPRLDLDSLFGSGPDDEPFQYTRSPAALRLLLETNQRGEMDLPRNSQGTALTGDPRNDENVIVSQLHLAFAKVFNKLADMVDADPSVAAEQRFETAQRLLRWHYQWIVVHDFLVRTCGESIVNSLVGRDKTGDWEVRRPHYQPRVEAYMPIEFSAAAFRFGHSQIRPTYDLNAGVTGRPIFIPGAAGEFDDLRGFRPLPQAWTVDWSLFAPTTDAPVQPSRLINSKMSSALFTLPDETDPIRQSLALRNLLRRQALALPSGQDVARLLEAEHVFTGSELNAPEPTPLWFYLLKEAELEEDNQGRRLGFCGAQMVAQVILGILEIDRRSWINVDPGWAPIIPSRGESLDLADLLLFAQG